MAVIAFKKERNQLENAATKLLSLALQAGAESAERRRTCFGNSGPGSQCHPGDGTRGQHGRRRGHRVLQLRRGEAGAAVTRRAECFRRIGERVRIEVDFGAELRDEQGQREPPAHQPDPSAVQLLRHGVKQPITAASAACRLAGFDLEPQDSADLALQSGGVGELRGGHDIHVNPVHGARAFAIHDTRCKADCLGVV